MDGESNGPPNEITSCGRENSRRDMLERAAFGSVKVATSANRVMSGLCSVMVHLIGK